MPDGIDSINQNQQKKQDKPLPQAILEGIGKSFAGKFGSGLGESLLDAIKGPEFRREKRMGEAEGLMERRGQQEDYISDISKRADLGQPIDDKTQQEALGMGISPALLDEYNQRATTVQKQRQQGLQSFMQAYQGGQFGDPNDPEVKRMAGIQAFALAHSDNPEIVAVMNNWTKLETAREEAQAKANIQLKTHIAEKEAELPIEAEKQKMIAGREEAVAGVRHGFAEEEAVFKEGLVRSRPETPAQKRGEARQEKTDIAGANKTLTFDPSFSRKNIPDIGMDFTLPGGKTISGHNMGEVMQSAVGQGILDADYAKRFMQQLQNIVNDPSQTDDSAAMWIMNLTKDMPEPFRSMLRGSIQEALDAADAAKAKAGGTDVKLEKQKKAREDE